MRHPPGVFRYRASVLCQIGKLYAMMKTKRENDPDAPVGELARLLGDLAFGEPFGPREINDCDTFIDDVLIESVIAHRPHGNASFAIFVREVPKTDTSVVVRVTDAVSVSVDGYVASDQGLMVLCTRCADLAAGREWITFQ